MTGTYKIADKVIKIESIYDGVHRLCRGYSFEGEADFSVVISQENIEYERAVNEQEHIRQNQPVPEVTDRYLETLAVYRKISEKLLDYDTFLFHGSAVELDGETYLFTAKSGTGKSTHTRLWRELYGDRAVMINDDKPLIRIEGDRAIIYGTPWNGKHRLGVNRSSRLKAICILERGAENKIFTVDSKEAYPRLLTQTYRPKDGVGMVRTLGLVDRLCKCVGLYKLECNMDIEAAKVSSEGMR